jgi:antitoxin VapB
MYMALSIKDPATDRLARELARTTGETITDAIKIALEERLTRERARRASHSLAAIIRNIQDSVARLPVLDARPAEELLGYDDAGLPS